MSEKTFSENVELDASLLSAAMRGGFSEFMRTAMFLGLKDPNEATRRAEWFKRQPKEYTDKVIANIVQDEK